MFQLIHLFTLSQTTLPQTNSGSQSAVRQQRGDSSKKVINVHVLTKLGLKDSCLFTARLSGVGEIQWLSCELWRTSTELAVNNTVRSFRCPTMCVRHRPFPFATISARICDVTVILVSLSDNIGQLQTLDIGK